MKSLLLTALLLLPFSLVNAEYLSTQNGMVASRSDIASEIGKDILEQGGNAIDAAVAVGFALAVAYPSAGNLGGGGFMLISLENGDVYAQDSRERAPGASTRDMFLDANGNADRNLSINSLQSSGVPGSVAGLLDALKNFGTMSRQDVMAPAIKLAKEGFILNEDLAGQFQRNQESFSQYPASLAKFSNNGAPYQAGDLWVQSDLAACLERIEEHGKDGFYKGKTADLIVAAMEAGNGLISHADLENYKVVWREPSHGSYRGYDVWSMPAPSSGGIVLVEMLNMIEPYDIKELGWGSTETVHLMIEAQRRAYADRATYIGDPDYVDVPAGVLTSKEYARQRFANFNPEQAGDSSIISAGQIPYESPQTTHYSIIDKDGNAVSMTTTLNRSYGNRFVVPGTGFLLNNEMDDFTSKVVGTAANEIKAGKRMLSSMSPTIVTKNQQAYLVTGSPGGSTIINTVFHILVNVLDHEMSITDAVTSPRFHHQWQPNNVRYEIGAISDDVADELRAMGHKGLTGSRFSIGDANSVLLKDSYEGMSDPRNVGGVAGH